MYKVLIKGCDPKLEGMYFTEATKEKIESGETIAIQKVLKNGTMAKGKNYYPFRSYHNNREVRHAYNQRNGKATIEIIEKVKEKELIKDVLYYNELLNSFILKLNNNIYNIKTHSSMKPDKVLWFDDEGEFYNNYCKGLITEKELKNAWFNTFAPSMLIKSDNDRNTHYLLKFGDTQDYTPRQFLGGLHPNEQETFKEALKHIKKAYDEELATFDKLYNTYYKGKLSIRGYWANR